MPTPQLIVPVGIPGCGKSTFADLFFSEARDTIVSTDAIRERMGDVADQSRNDDVFEIFHDIITRRLIDNCRVFADATNLTFNARFRLMTIAEDNDAECHLLIFNNLAQAVKRNANRKRVVPDEAMTRMVSNYEKFKLDLPKEYSIYDSVTQIGEF
jgi:predicted kinase